MVVERGTERFRLDRSGSVSLSPLFAMELWLFPLRSKRSGVGPKPTKPHRSMRSNSAKSFIYRTGIAFSRIDRCGPSLVSVARYTAPLPPSPTLAVIHAIDRRRSSRPLQAEAQVLASLTHPNIAAVDQAFRRQ